MTNDLQGKLAVVTGGASGIGLALAKSYGQRGARLLLADRDESALARAAVTFAEMGIETRTHVVDLRDPSAVAELGDRAKSLGPVVAICLNAGVLGGGDKLWETPHASFEFVFGVNFWGLLNSIKSLVPLVVAQDRPADVVVTTSLAGLLSLPDSGPYTTSKAAAVALAKVLRTDLASAAPQVRVACLAPGMVRTNLARTTAAQRPERTQAETEGFEQGHRMLNAGGVSPDDVASWAHNALDRGQFWVLPPADDPYTSMLATEVEELSAATRAVLT